MDLYRQPAGFLGRGISSVARPLPTQDDIEKEETRADIRASSGIRTHDPSVRGGEYISWLRPRGHCDRQARNLRHFILLVYKAKLILRETIWDHSL
jgi:hypothetical protein